MFGIKATFEKGSAKEEQNVPLFRKVEQNSSGKSI
jgi:hypothetical protein